jgi:hypothetical protein
MSRLTKRVTKTIKSSEPGDNLKRSTIGDAFECRMPLWKLATRVIGFCMVIGLTVALILSEITMRKHGFHQYSFKEIALYAVLFCFNAMILLPALFEVRLARGAGDELVLCTLWWKANLTGNEIVEFRNPRYLKFAMVRTKRCIYLLNKQDLSNYPILEAYLSRKVNGESSQGTKSSG